MAIRKGSDQQTQPSQREAPVGGIGDADNVNKSKNHDTDSIPKGKKRSWSGALIATAVFAPTAAALMSVSGVIVRVDYTRLPTVRGVGLGVFLMQLHPLVAALLILLGVWLLLAILFYFLGYTTARGASAGSYADLWTEVAEIDAWLHYMDKYAGPDGRGLNQAQETALNELRLQRKELDDEGDARGSQWVSGTGYIRLWRRLHRAQQAMLELAPPGSALKRAQYDYLRLKGSKIPGSDVYQDLLLRSIEVLSCAARPSVQSAYASLRETENLLKNQLTTTPAVIASQVSKSKEALDRVCADLTAFRVQDLEPTVDVLAAVPASPPDQLLKVRDAIAILRPFADALPDHDTAVPSTAPRATQMLPTTTVSTSSSTVVTTQPDQLPPPRSQQEATDRVRVVKRAIDEFRDDSRAALVRSRGHLSWLVALTALNGYTLIWIVVALHASIDSIGAGTVFFLVGALVGLFTHLYTGESDDAGVEDFGTSETQLLATPLLSGVAAVLGVTLVAVGANAAQGLGEGVLPKAFNLQSTPVNLVVAAVFGFTPKLLIDRLTAKVDSYKQDLRTSEAATSTSVTAMSQAHTMR